MSGIYAPFWELENTRAKLEFKNKKHRKLSEMKNWPIDGYRCEGKAEPIFPSCCFWYSFLSTEKKKNLLKFFRINLRENDPAMGEKKGQNAGERGNSMSSRFCEGGAGHN